MSEHKKNGERVRQVVRQVLLASAALAPVMMYAPEAAAQAAVTVNAGADRAVNDTDGSYGEYVTLQGTASGGSSGGGQLSLIWTDQNNNQIGFGATDTVYLPDGANRLTLTARDFGNSSVAVIDTVVITVKGPNETVAGTPNEQAIGSAMDSLCGRLTAFGGEGGGNFGAAGRNVVAPKAAAAKAAPGDNLRDRCFDLEFDQRGNARNKALEQWGAEEFNSIRNLTVVFSQTQFQSVMDRLQAVRAGQRGLSLAGLTLNNGGQTVNGDQIAQGVSHLIGGASADDAPGGLMDDRLGFWLRGNYGTGEKESSLADGGFDADQFGVSGGIDYRFGSNAVLGLSFGYGQSNLEFNSSTSSTLDATSVAVSAYGTGYIGGFYVDAVANYVDSNYDTKRHVADFLFGVPADVNARGETEGGTTSTGLALGYDFAFGGFTFAPSVGYYYVNAKVKGFTERGGAGLDLSFTDQDYKSSNATAGLRLSYAWKTSWGVVMPHLRGTFVREFEDDTEVFGVRFADDPFVPPADPAPPITVRTDEVDPSYIRIAAGFSMQMKHGISSYVDYQTIQGFKNTDFSDVTVGLRIQHSF